MMVGGRIAKLEHTMEDAWTRIVDVFAARGVVCEFVFGPQNRELNGSPPRIQFERKDGAARFSGTRASNGEFAQILQVCDARVWGLQSGEDFEKHQSLAALGLLVELMGAFYAVAPRYPGEDNGGLSFTYSNETHVLHYGEHFIATFQFLAPLKWVSNDEFLATGGTNANLNKRS
jgi:hypothetical protein